MTTVSPEIEPNNRLHVVEGVDLDAKPPIEVFGSETSEEISHMVIDGITYTLGKTNPCALPQSRVVELVKAESVSVPTIASVNTGLLIALSSLEHVATAKRFPNDVPGSIWKGRDKRSNSAWRVLTQKNVVTANENTLLLNMSWLMLPDNVQTA